MESSGESPASAAAGTISVGSSPPHDLHCSPVGSPLIADLKLEGEAEEEAPPSSDKHQTPTLTDDLRDKIIKQVEYYFSDENLPTDKFMMKYVTKNVDGFVPIDVIASFRKMKKLTQERSLIVEALRQSSFLVVSSSGKNVRRLYPMLPEVNDPMLRTVLVENLPDDHSEENIRTIFDAAGNIKNICVRDPQAVKEPSKRTTAEKLLSGKLHALVEYETVEAAEKAVVLLKNEQDWRFGMRVKLLKRTGKKGEKKKCWRDTDFEKNHDADATDPAGHVEDHRLNEHHDDTHDEEEGDRKDKNGQKDRNRWRGRGQKYRGTNGQGYGSASGTHATETLKPPPGPRMPDGTKGFSMGRGRPLAPVQS